MPDSEETLDPFSKWTAGNSMGEKQAGRVCGVNLLVQPSVHVPGHRREKNIQDGSGFRKGSAVSDSRA